MKPEQLTKTAMQLAVPSETLSIAITALPLETATSCSA
jgi:hypothetical protein